MSRDGQRSSRLRHRPSRAIPSIIAGILLLAAGVALAWLAITRLANGTWPTLLQGPRDWLAVLAWNDPAIRQIGIAAVVAGVVLLLCAFIPGGFNALTIDDSRSGAGAEEPPVQERETVMTRRAVARLAKARCLQIDGVGSAAATATTRRVHLKRDDLPARARGPACQDHRRCPCPSGRNRALPGSAGYGHGPVQRLRPFAHPPAATI